MAIISPKSRNTFQYPLSIRVYANAFRNAFLELLRISSNYRELRVARKALSTAQLHCAVDPESRDHVGHTPLRRSVGDINAFQNSLCVIISIETRFWLKRVTGCVYHHFSGVELRFPNDFQGDFCR